MLNKLAIAKTAINFTVGAGVSKVVTDIIRNNTTTETTADSAKIFVGGVVLGSMVADAASVHVNAKVDGIAAWYADQKNNKTNS